MMTLSTINKSPDTSGPAKKKPPYRSDIDGLRAVAVLLVVIFHASPELLPGGFAGVDIFFVISGFLITGIIISDMRNGTFSISGFYARRCRRILPAMITVMTATVIAGYFLLFADDYRLLGKHIAASACFSSNIAFFLESGYFDAAGISKPMLHMWSLAVEEQFYLLWPLILYLTRKSKLYLTAAIFLLLISLIAGHAESLRSLNAAFYLLPFRLWELMAGGIIAMADTSPQYKTHGKIAGIAPAVLLGIFLCLPDCGKFSTLKLTLPVGATVLFIINGPTASLNQLLSHRLFTWLGKISYPLYLWHWPLLSFGYLVRGNNVRWETRCLLVGLSLILADLTWRLIEKPAQQRLFSSHEAPHKNRLWIITGASALLCSALCGLLVYHGILMSTWQHRTEGLAAYRDYVNRIPPSFFELRDIEKPDYSKIPFPKLAADKDSVIILGDSIADRLAYGLGRYLAPHHVPVYSLTASACQPLSNNGWPQCEEFNKRALLFLEGKSNVIVIIASAWQIHYTESGFKERLASTVLALRRAGVRHVILAGQTPQWNKPLYKILMETGHTEAIPKYSDAGLLETIFETEEILKSSIPPGTADFVPILGHFCDNRKCLVHLGNQISTDLVSFDNGHPTTTASDYIADKSLGPAILRILEKQK